MKKEKKKPEAEETEKVNEPEETAEAVEEKKEPTAEEKLQDELKAEKEKYIRLYAEYDNYRKRTSAEKLQIYDDATAHAVKELLPLADSLTNALAQFEGKDVPEEFSKGIELIAQQLKQSFEKLKVEAFCEVGDTFDPELHNAVSMTEDDSLPENSISAVYQKGYRIGDKIIRHAMVVVANA
ncbi:MAG: nucleotide exchange factor GrpE [Ruminococcus sp.]|nr:nucleotide exchange factor GrpE [Ruminococcus sp.]